MLETYGGCADNIAQQFSYHFSVEDDKKSEESDKSHNIMTFCH